MALQEFTLTVDNGGAEGEWRQFWDGCTVRKEELLSPFGSGVGSSLERDALAGCPCI